MDELRTSSGVADFVCAPLFHFLVLGALFVEATETDMIFEFVNVAGELIDRYVLEAN